MLFVGFLKNIKDQIEFKYSAPEITKISTDK